MKKTERSFFLGFWSWGFSLLQGLFSYGKIDRSWRSSIALWPYDPRYRLRRVWQLWRECGVRSVLWDPFIRFAFDDNNEKLSKISESCNFYSPSCPLLNEESAELYEALPNRCVGRLEQSIEGGGKRRIFAIGNWVTQRLLAPLHKWLMSVLRTIPMDVWPTQATLASPRGCWMRICWSQRQPQIGGLSSFNQICFRSCLGSSYVYCGLRRWYPCLLHRSLAAFSWQVYKEKKVTQDSTVTT